MGSTSSPVSLPVPRAQTSAEQDPTLSGPTRGQTEQWSLHRGFIPTPDIHTALPPRLPPGETSGSSPCPPRAVPIGYSPWVSKRGQGHHLAATHHHCTYPCARSGGCPGCHSCAGTGFGPWGAVTCHRSSCPQSPGTMSCGAHAVPPLTPWPGHPGIPGHPWVSRWAEGASSAAPIPALAPPPPPCCSVQCQPAVTRDLLVCTAGFIEHRKAGSGRGRLRTEPWG